MARVPVQTLPQEQLTTQGPGLLQVSTGVQPMENLQPRQQQAMGEAMARAGSAMTMIATKLQDDLNDSRSTDAFNQFSAKVDEIEARYLTTQGKAAVDEFPKIQGSTAELVDQFSQGLDNEVQRRIFRENAGRRLRSVNTAATRHSIVEGQRYRVGEAKNKIETLTNTAVRYANTRDIVGGDFDVYSGSAIVETNRLADELQLPKDSEQRAAMVRETQTKIHAGVVQAMVIDNKFVNAMDYLEDAFEAGEMDQPVYTQLRAAVNVGYRRERGVSAAERVYQAAPVAATTKGANFDDAAKFVLSVEGGYVADDAGAGPSNLGINKKANPDVDVANLTPSQAVEIYRKRYWNAIGADKLPPEMRLVAFDTAVNMGPSAANRLLREADGDPAKMIELRRQHYAKLIKDDPAKYGRFKEGWENRLRKLETTLAAEAKEPSINQMLTDFRALVTDPEERQYGEAYLRQTYEQDQAVREEQYTQIFREAERIRAQPNATWRDVPPAIMARLKPEDRNKIISGPPRVDDPDIRIMLLNNPQLWKTGNIEKYRYSLSEPTYLDFYKKGNDATGDESIRAATIDAEQFRATLLRNNLTGLLNPSSDTEKADVIRLRDQFQRQIDQEQKVKKRILSLDEKQVILDNILTDKVMVEDGGFMFFDKEKPMFMVTDDELAMTYVNIGGENIRLAGIPADERAKINETLRRRGMPINSRNIATLWVQAGKPGVKR